jgi:Arc/MetJ-type ribon-helix-helix transcriptional regulator
VREHTPTKRPPDRVNLTPHQGKAIREAIEAGLVESVDEFIETAIEALPHRDRTLDAQI